MDRMIRLALTEPCHRFGNHTPLILIRTLATLIILLLALTLLLLLSRASCCCCCCRCRWLGCGSG
jgi:hypothetical protein